MLTYLKAIAKVQKDSMKFAFFSIELSERNSLNVNAARIAAQEKCVFLKTLFQFMHILLVLLGALTSAGLNSTNDFLQ